MVRTSSSTLDPYADDGLLDPWPLYGELRKMGPAVWLDKYQMVALTRYDAVLTALRDWEAFPSTFGVVMNDDMNQVLARNTLCSDGAAHKRLRRVVIRPLTPAAQIIASRSRTRGRSGCRPTLRQGEASARPLSPNSSKL
jgi:cytochrome P450